MLQYELPKYSIIVSVGRLCNDSNLNYHAAILDEMLTHRKTLKGHKSIEELDRQIDTEARQVMYWGSSSAGPKPIALLEIEASKRDPRDERYC